MGFVLFKNILDILGKIFILIFMLFNASYASVVVSSYPEIKVDGANLNHFSTPLGYYNGLLYTVNVEPATSSFNTRINLRTVVRSIVANDSTNLAWNSTVIDSETIEDRYHTQASIAVDKLGFLHVAYGMHNMPWQYVISNKPGSIASFTFYGDTISLTDKIAVKVFNKTNFPKVGEAIIPGNQITYPAFFYDKNNELYITYRFAVKPKLKFTERGYSAAIARYDAALKKWIALGGDIIISQDDASFEKNKSNKLVKVFSYQQGWTVYPPRLAFDDDNGLHAVWTWRQNKAGGDTTHPSYAYSPSNSNYFYNSSHKIYTLPITQGKADWVGNSMKNRYSSVPQICIQGKFAYIILQYWKGKRILYILDRDLGEWLGPEILPYGASTIKIDSYGGQWAFATGLKVLYRKKPEDHWKLVFEDKSNNTYGYPKVLQVQGKNLFFVHTQGLDSNFVKIYRIQF